MCCIDRSLLIPFHISHESDTTTVELTELEVEMQAGGMDEVEINVLLDKLAETHPTNDLTFLDYLAYMPLWLGLHDAIVDNPIHTEFHLSGRSKTSVVSHTHRAGRR